MRRRALMVVALAAMATPLAAHVGSLSSFYEGAAGPYPVRVVVRPPGVVPGLAEITVRTSSPGITRVAVKPVKWDAGEAGTPPADEAKPVSGDRSLYAANLWLMTRGSYSIYVDVAGPHGTGRAIVPITNIATRRLPMPRSTGVLLAIFGALLAAGAISIAGAGARESRLAPGAAVDTTHRRRGWMAMGATALVLALMVGRGNAWWSAIDREYRARMDKPFHVTTATRDGMLNLTIDDRAWHDDAARFTPLMPDHGKLMHLFLIDESKSTFAHLHPLSDSRDRFHAALPPLPPGRYRLFADITHESGYTQTLVDRLTVPAIAAAPAATDEDDSWMRGNGSGAIRFASREPLRANADTDLRFTVDGTPEPYMGMPGHAIVVADDFSVFVHLHPMGSVSMATQQKFLERDRKQSAAHASMTVMTSDMLPMPMAGANAASSHELRFPFAFPHPGRYRIWVQTRMNGRVVTGVHDVTVQ